MASVVAKVPAITLGFWLIKILATTLGETGGDAVTMSMNLGYLTGTAIFATLFTACVLVQIRAKQFHPLVYWTTIVASTTVGTTLADFVTRSIGISGRPRITSARSAPRHLTLRIEMSRNRGVRSLTGSGAEPRSW